MRDWKGPEFLGDPSAESRGRVEVVTLTSKHFGEPLGINVYLPNGYDPPRNYPVVYVQGGAAAINEGMMVKALDNLIGKKGA